MQPQDSVCNRTEPQMHMGAWIPGRKQVLFAIVNISVTPIVNARDVSFTSVMVSFVIAGRIRLMTWRKNNSYERLSLCVSKYLGSFLLSLRHRLNSPAINFCKICALVQYKSNCHSHILPGLGNLYTQNIKRSKIDHHKLKHQRSSSHH